MRTLPATNNYTPKRGLQIDDYQKYTPDGVCAPQWKILERQKADVKIPWKSCFRLGVNETEKTGFGLPNPSLCVSKVRTSNSQTPIKHDPVY